MPDPYIQNPTFVENASTQGDANNARSQQNLAETTSQTNGSDWRVKISLAPQSTYLYNANPAGILAPLRDTDGVIFPYTPSIRTSYVANYTAKQLTHSNYTGQFYQGSEVKGIDISGLFTAQDSSEANYLLAVIHFFRSVTKMFYGQDAERGSPPPLVYINGLGPNQFIEHTGVVASFNYDLPDNVDYIRAKIQPNTYNYSTAYPKQTATTVNISPTTQRLGTAGLPAGGINPSKYLTQSPQMGESLPSYVPTKMTIAITILPIQTRRQLSQQFSLKGFATGELLKQGFW